MITSLPISATNESSISASDLPACCIARIFSLAALQTPQEGCIWQAIFSLHPQLQFILPATFITA